MELENHAKRAAQLEAEVKGKVLNYLIICSFVCDI